MLCFAAGATDALNHLQDPVLSADCYCDAEDSGEFMLLADVKLVVQGGQELPAHSHILAVHSRVLLNLISGLDTPPTPANPFVLKEACAAWPLDDVLLLLKHAYKRSKFATERETWRLLDIAGMEIRATELCHDVLLPPEYHVCRCCQDVADPLCPKSQISLMLVLC